MSRQEAIDAGNKLYFTGKQCKNGHIAQRHTLTRQCVLCDQVWRQREKERFDAARARTEASKPVGA